MEGNFGSLPLFILEYEKKRAKNSNLLRSILNEIYHFDFKS